MAKFPKTIYLTREADTDGTTWFNANDSVPDVDSNTPLGIYQLVESAEIVVTREVKKQQVKKPQ